MQAFMNKVINPIVKRVLRSPLHRLVSKSTLLITVIGRKSGKPYTLPVNYVQVGKQLLIISDLNRTWWRNLKGGIDVVVQLRGKEHQGVGQVFIGEQATPYALYMLQHSPQLQRFTKISLASDGTPIDHKHVDLFMTDHVIIQVMLQ